MVFQTTPTYQIGMYNENRIYIKRDDLLPYSFGGNKARKAVLFFEEIDKGGYDAVVTYGSGGSNHCRIIANMAAERNIPCHIISTDEESDSLNRTIVELFGAKITSCTVDKVSRTIDAKIEQLKEDGYKPYFIAGGGHGNIGTKAYDLAYDEIKEFEKQSSVSFDYIFIASGTGTTHAGLICGHLRYGDDTKIVGISIARPNPRGKQVVIDSVVDYRGDCPEEVLFEDKYICGGYGAYNDDISDTIKEILIQNGIPLDYTYTGKAFTGMKKYLKENNIKDKNILFIHTGGTPIFCDWLTQQK